MTRQLTKNRQVNLAELRQRAEAAIDRGKARLAAGPGLLAEAEIQRLLEELSIYQTELEIQNQELTSTQSALALALERSQALFGNLPLPGIIVDSLGFIVEANEAARDFLGLQPTVTTHRRSVMQLFPGDSRGRIFEALRIRHEATPRSIDVQDIRVGSGGGIPCNLHVIHLPDESRDDYRILMVLVDRSSEVALRELEVQAERQRAAEVLRRADERWQFALEGAGDGVWDIDLESHEAHYSRRFEEILGYAEGEFCKTYDAWLDHLHPADRRRAVAVLGDYLEGRSAAYAAEYRLRGKDGDYRWIHARGMAVRRSGEGGPRRMVGTISDITGRKRAEEQLRIAAVAFESQEGILITDADGIVLRVNSAFSAMTGYAAEESIGQNARRLISDREDAASYDVMWDTVRRSGSWQGEVWNRRKSGEAYPERITVTAVTGEAAAVSHYVITCTDITFRKAAEDEIKHLAFYDPLTQLPNRRLMRDRLTQALTSSARRGRRGALMLIDLDNFKTLNDLLGHAAGDQLLVEVAARLESSIRQGDTAARLGGDEFVVILEDLDESALAAAQAEAVAVKIQAKLGQPYLLDSLPAGEDPGRHSHICTSSIGIAMFGEQAVTVDDLLQRADTAMYRAKLAGRNTLRYFDPELQLAIRTRAALEGDLRKGIIEEECILHFQPQVDSAGRVVGAEALIRWQHPSRGLVSPTEFIAVAEESGLILPIGRWVLASACRLLANWAGQADLAHLSLAVNVSALQFGHPMIVEQILALVEQTGAPPDKLKLELTESLLLDNAESIITKMTALKARGVGFSLDDFGTGYSSLSYLKRLPLDQLKIDRSFMQNVLHDPNDAAITRTILALGQTLGLAVIAEGVESAAQRDFLYESGCHVYQGYLFSRPVPLESFEAFVRNAATATAPEQ